MDNRKRMWCSVSLFTLGLLAIALAGGCSEQPSTGTQAVETPQVQQQREDSIKDAMRKGAYGDQYKTKADPPK